MSPTETAVADHAAALHADLRRWLASGDLQSGDGAFRAWRDAGSDELAFAYPEITGYALTWLAGREDPTDAEREAGVRAADWLVDRFGRGDRSAREGWDGGAVYTFDLGMIAAGLQSFGRSLGSAVHAALGERIASGLAGLVHSRHGLRAIDPAGPRTARPPEWSTEGLPHLVKCVQALLLAGEDDAACALAATAAGRQRPDGRFVTQPHDDRVMLHPHLYTVEGLWMFGSARGDADALERARRGAAWAWEQRLDSGGLPRYAVVSDRVDPAPEQWDVTSQAVRAVLMTGADAPGLDRAVARLGELARPARDGTALVYQPASDPVHLNAWVSMFGGQALELVAHGSEAMTWQDLV